LYSPFVNPARKFYAVFIRQIQGQKRLFRLPGADSRFVFQVFAGGIKLPDLARGFPDCCGFLACDTGG
jgi:hypothetical protein